MNEYWLGRLPLETRERVLQGDLSLDRACVEAGIRRKRRSITIDTPDAALSGLLRVFDWDQLFNALMRLKD